MLLFALTMFSLQSRAQNVIKFTTNKNAGEKITIGIFGKGEITFEGLNPAAPTDFYAKYEITNDTIIIKGDVKQFDCRETGATSLNVTGNVVLEYLACDKNELEELDVTQNEKLIRIYCNSNKIKTLDVSKNANLQWLQCHQNELTSLNFENNMKLQYLTCAENKIKGESMTAMLNSLPMRAETEETKLWLIRTSETEQNEYADTDLQITKSKNWKTYKVDENWKETEITPDITDIETIADGGLYVAVSDGFLNIINAPENSKIELYDIKGISCCQANTTENGSASLNVSALPEGVYILCVGNIKMKITL